jgi:energy-converting hydrogenase Eha subunit A
MKKLFGVFMLLVAAFALYACDDKAGDDEFSGVLIEGRSHFLLTDEGVELEAKLIGSDENVEFTWKSSDTSVLEVAPKEDGDNTDTSIGVVKPKKLGKAKLTVTVKGKKNLQGFLNVEVKEELVKPEKVVLYYLGGYEAFLDSEVPFAAKVYPEGADPQIYWETSDEVSAPIQAQGLSVLSSFMLDNSINWSFAKITGKITGEVTVTAYAAGAEVFPDPEDAEKPLVVEASVDVNILSHIDVEGDSEIKVGGTAQLSATVNNTIEYKNEITWSSSDATVASVDANGLVTAKKIGKAVITASAPARFGSGTKSVLYPIEVLTEYDADELAGGAEGIRVSFKYASAEVKAKILAALERHLINRGASIPVINNSGVVVYSERVTLPTEKYVPLMGFGALYGELADNDVEHPYRMYTTADPKTFNHLMYKDSIESDMLSLIELSLFSFEFVDSDDNGLYDSYALLPSAAANVAEPVEFNEETGEWEVIEDFDYDNDAAEAWKITLRDNLFWVDNNGHQQGQITAEDFVYTYQMALDPVQQNSRANYFYSAAGLPIKNAEAYYKQWDDKKTPHAPAKGLADGNYEYVKWSEVGVHKVDDLAFVLELSQAYQQWDIHYNTSGFLFSPVYKPLFEAGFGNDPNRKSTNYGSALDKFMSSGPYYLSYRETEKEYRFTKNQHYTYNEGCPEMTPAAIKYTIVKDANAAIELFEKDQLDSVSIPATHYDQYKNHAGLKKAPGATSFRFTVNRMTQAESDLLFGIGAWKVKPILQEDDFMWALYFAMDRNEIENISKTYTPEQFYFTQAYVVDPKAGEAYRDTDAGKQVGVGIFKGDVNLSTETLGVNKELATNYYVKALDSMIAKGVITEGTASKKTVIEVEIAAFDSVTWTNIIEYLAEDMAATFNAQTKYPNIEIKFIPSPQPGMNVYYEKQMKGRFDLALAGISGGLLDPIGFMECFCDDNRSGLMLSWGFNSHIPAILIDLDLDGDGENDGPKYWSFDALYSACAGSAFVKMGVEAEEPKA